MLPQHTRDAWFQCAHDIVPTRALVHARKVGTTSPECPQCDVPDTLQHRLTACGDADGIWAWLQRLLGVLLECDVEWSVMVRPDFKAADMKRQAVAIWAAGHTVAYLVGGSKRAADDFLAMRRRQKADVLRTQHKWPKPLIDGLSLYVECNSKK